MSDGSQRDPADAAKPSDSTSEASGTGAGDDGRQESRSATRTQERAGGPSQGNSIGRSLLMFLKEVVIVVVLAVVLPLVLKTWFVQSFWIPSGSMNNTLVKDDRVSVSKLTPRFFDLKRGDIVVFADPGEWLTDVVPPQQGPVAERINSVLSWVGLLPNDEGNHLIKRIIGLPGDKVQCCTADGRLLVNNAPITEPYVYPGDRPSDITFDITVPADHLWVMGDHRSNSKDSRYNDAPADNGSLGSVPIDNVVGRAFAVVWPLSKLSWLSTPESTFARVPDPGAAPADPTPGEPGQTSPAPPATEPTPAPTPSPSPTAATPAGTP